MVAQVTPLPPRASLPAAARTVRAEPPPVRDRTEGGSENGEASSSAPGTDPRCAAASSAEPSLGPLAEPVDSADWVHESWSPPAARGRTALGWARLRRGARRFGEEERGAVTAEYAIVIMAAVAFAGLLVAIMRSGEIRSMLVDLVENALGAAG